MDLNQRLERLERQNRWLQAVALVALIGIGLMFFIGRPRAGWAKGHDVGELTGSSLALTDKNGNTYLSANNSDGTTMLELHSTAGGAKGYILIDAGEGGAGFKAQVGLDSQKRPEAHLGAGEKRASLRLTAHGQISTVIRSPGGPGVPE
jgi:hypothetical protein